MKKAKIKKIKNQKSKNQKSKFQKSKNQKSKIQKKKMALLVQTVHRTSWLYGVSAGKRDQIENFFKKKFLSKIDVDLIIWSRILITLKKIFLLIWSFFPALTPYGGRCAAIDGWLFWIVFFFGMTFFFNRATVAVWHLV